MYLPGRCDKLPFTAGESREAIESRLPAVQFAIVARLGGIASLVREEAGGAIRCQNMSLRESCGSPWKAAVKL